MLLDQSIIQFFFLIILQNQSDIDLDNMQLLCEEQMEQQSL